MIIGVDRFLSCQDASRILHLLWLIFLSWPTNGVYEAHVRLLCAGVLHRKASIAVHNLNALSKPVSIRGFSDIWHALFNAFVVDSKFDLAFVNTAFDWSV